MGGHSVSVSSVSVSVLSLRTELTSQKNTAKQEEKSSVHAKDMAVDAAGDLGQRQARCLEARSPGAAKSKEKGRNCSLQD